MAAFCMSSLQSSLASLEISAVGRRATGARPTALKISLAPKAKLAGIKGFDGFSNNILEFNRKSETSIDNGNIETITAIRHSVRKKRSLGVRPAHRRSMLKNLTTEVLYYGRIKTTQSRAKAVEPYVNKMVTLALKGGSENKQRAMAWIHDKQLVQQLFTNVPETYGDRSGRFCKVTNLDQRSNRKGDNAAMAEIELL